MQRSRAVKLSERHEVTVDEDYLAMIERAPQQDYVVRTLAKRVAGEMVLMSGELVIAGRQTREQFPLAAAYPMHFRKTYFPGQLRGDPKGEFENHARASELIAVPAPIGYSGSTFRSCLLPGRPFHKLSPFGTEPEESNLKHADKLPLESAAGLWLLSQQIYATVRTLQRGGMTHGDAELHNFIVCPAPLEVLPIDFDMALREQALSPEAWQERCARDLEPLLKLAVFLQCALGAQPGELAELSRARIDTLFQKGALFQRAISDRSGLLASS